MKMGMEILPSTAARWRQMRFNPIRSLTPTTLARDLDQFEAGYLRGAALLWDVIEDRDDVAKLAAGKRKKSVARRPWEVLVIDDTPEAQAHKTAIEFFYNNLTVTDAVRLDLRTGFSGLVRQMMDAQFKGYAAHELIWRPGAAGLTAELKFVPLYFFEARSGRLRFTGPEMAHAGRALAQDEWLITVGDGLMAAISICYMFKRLSLQDWLTFSEKFGMPGIHGLTDAASGSQEWTDFVDALDQFSNDWVAATNKSADIKLIESSRTGDAPFEPMVERMDRKIAALCRGADLSTMSRTDGAGASLQGDESNLLLEDDCALISETLNTQIDRLVIEYTFGTKPLAYVKILPPQTVDSTRELEVDRFLLESGAPLGVSDVLERYGRSMPDYGEELLQGKSAAPQSGSTMAENATGDATDVADDGRLGLLLAEARDLFGAGIDDDMEPLRAALGRAIDGLGSEAEIRQRLQDLLAALRGPVLDAVLAGEAASDALEQVLATAMLNGIEEDAPGAVDAENAARRKPQAQWGKGEKLGGKFRPWTAAERERENWIREQVQRGRKAMRRVAADKVDVLDAMERDEIGTVDFLWDNDGYGIRHIIERRDAQDRARPLVNRLSPDELLDRLPEVIARGDITPGGSKIAIEYLGLRAILATKAGRSTNLWVLTGVEINELGKGGNR